MTASDACCTLPVFKSDYTPRGTVTQTDDLAVYLTGERSSKRAIILIYDIFGLTPNIKQTADVLASRGFRVALPDVFRGNAWGMNDVPIDRPKLMAHLEKHANQIILAKDLSATIEALKNEGSELVGCVGFCWGALHACLNSKKFRAIGSAHPSMLSLEIVKHVEVPVIFLPSKDEADMTPLMDVLRSQQFGADCEHHRFEDMHHGWCAARADFSNSLVAKRATEAIDHFARFFEKTLG